jgi:uncharacterized membrane protein YqjE
MEGLIAVEIRVRKLILCRLLLGLFLFLYLILVIGTFSFAIDRNYKINDMRQWIISFIINIGIIFPIKMIYKNRKNYLFSVCL